MPSVVHDVFPATVVITNADFPTPVGELRSQPPTKNAAYIAIARVVVTSEHIIVARDSQAGPVVVFREAIDPTLLYKTSDPRTKDSYVTTLSGKKIAYRKETSCGCGSRLKSWRPFSIMSSIKDPTS